MKILLEARLEGRWCPVRIAHEFLGARMALDSLPVFARQQKVNQDDVRMSALRTEEQLTVAEYAVIAYHHDPEI